MIKMINDHDGKYPRIHNFLYLLLDHMKTTKYIFFKYIFSYVTFLFFLMLLCDRYVSCFFFPMEAFFCRTKNQYEIHVVDCVAPILSE